MYRNPRDNTRTVLMALVLTLVLAGCSGSVMEGEVFNRDHTVAVGSTNWIVRAEILDQGVRSLPSIEPKQRELFITLDVSEQLFHSPDFWFGSAETQTSQPIAPGLIEAVIESPSIDIDLVGRDVIVLLSPIGEDLAPAYGTSYAVVLVADTTWTPIQAGFDALFDVNEVLALTDQPPEDELLALVASAIDSKRSRMLRLAEEDALRDAIASGLVAEPANQQEKDLIDQMFPRAGKPINTSGPLGEWRRANGWEAGQGIGGAPALDGWLDTPANERQLGVLLEELPVGSAQALGLGEWEFRQFVFVPDEAFLLEHSWVGLRFPNVGTLGPFFAGIEPGGPVHMTGYAPPNQPAQLVAWADPGTPELRSAVVLATIPALHMSPTSVVWAEAAKLAPNSSWETLSPAEASLRLSQMATTESEGSSEAP